VSAFAWGAATLAYMYKQLGYALIGGLKQIVRYMPLLDVFL